MSDDELDLFQRLAKLGIKAPREIIEALLRNASKMKMSPRRLLETLCIAEQQERERRNLARRIKMATLGTPTALDQFDWNHPREIDKALFEELYELNFLRRGHNVLMRGPAGVGKSTLTQHLGYLPSGKRPRCSSMATAAGGMAPSRAAIAM